MSATDVAVVLHRRVNATPDQVFAAWVDPELFVRWMSAPEFPATIVEFDARVGGRYEFHVTGPEGEVHSTSGEYKELEPGVRLVKTWIYTGPHPAADRGESLVTVTFREIETGVTAMTLRHDRVATESGRETLRQGWTACLEELEKLFGIPPEWRLQIVRQISAPVSKIFDAWTAPQLLEQWLTTRAEVDARIGGRYRLEFRDEANPGVVQVIAGEYLELVPDRRIVKSWTYVSDDPAEVTETVVEVDLVEKSPEVVEMTVVERGQIGFDAQETEETRQAWEGALETLAGLLE